jgi:adenine deaminase
MLDLQTVALGEESADLVIENGRVVRPEIGDIVSKSVVIKNGRVVTLTEDATPAISGETTVIDTEGSVITPGFINPHVHVDSFQPFEKTYHRVLEGGTTTIITETSEFASCFGPAGIEQLLDATAPLPVDVFATVSPRPLLDLFEPAPADSEETKALLALLDRDRILGVGEAEWIQVVGRASPVDALYERAREEGKRISGHGTGCSGANLAAFASIVTNDHEAITGEQIIERVENGIHAIGRYGSFRDDIPALAEAYGRLGPDELSLSTDWIWPAEINEEGYMDAVIRRAIEEGVEPIHAVRMATLNPARQFGLDWRGSLSPGSVADILILSDLEKVRVETVVSGGEIVVRAGESLVAPRSHEYPESFRDSVAVELDPETFQIPEDVGEDGAIRAIQYEEGTVSSETTVSPRIEDGVFEADPEREVLKVALLDRRSADNRGGFTGFISGFDLTEGAIATSHTWQQAGVIVVGADDESMVRATEQVGEMGGGWVVMREDLVIATFPTPIGGRCADLSVEKSAAQFDEVENAIRKAGVSISNPALTLQSLSFAGVPALRMGFSGYLDVFGQEVVGLAPETE